MKRILFFLLLTTFCWNGFAQTPLTSLRVVSDPPDYIGFGKTYNYGPETPFVVSAATALTTDSDTVGFLEGVDLKVSTWHFRFGADNGMLKTGFYERAKRLAFMPGHPSIDISNDHRGCNRAAGSFAVLDAGVDDSDYPPKLTSFAAVFDFQCEEYPYGLTGILHWNYVPNSNLAISSPVLSASETAVATVTLVEPAPPGGASVELVSNAPEIIPPQKLMIPAGERRAEFLLSAAHSPIADQRVRFLALVNGKASAAEVQVLAPSRQITRIELDSDPGDFIGFGKTLTYTATDGYWIAGAGWSAKYGPPSVTGVVISFHGASSFWYFLFDSGISQMPFPGVYPAARRWGDSGAGPGFSISGSPFNANIGLGCNSLTGFFRVLVADIDYWHEPAKVNRFAAEFEQHCEGAAPALRGRVYYNYLPPARSRAVK